jgi:NAD(P)-dependent dehydrogenase (short-subunit alcohol dehydrogenase family)
VTRRFEDRVAVVTGAGSGIGAATARLLAREGAALTLADVDGAAVEALARELVAGGARAQAVTTDVGRSDEVETMLAATTSAFSGVDILVNCAGILRLGQVVDVSDEAWELTIRTNLSSVFYCSRGAASRMIAQGRGGRIITISSIHAVLSNPNAGPYTAAKGGIEALSRTLASEVADHGITVNCVRPGATWTNLSRPYYTPPVLEALGHRVPMKEVAQPEWIADAVAHFASDAARYSTGTTLDVDGGYVMHGGLADLTYA